MPLVLFRTRHHIIKLNIIPCPVLNPALRSRPQAEALPMAAPCYEKKIESVQLISH